MADKADHEIEVFTSFVKTARLAVEERSIEARNPPEPDIRCNLAGSTQYFELGRLLDSELPKLRIEMIRSHPTPVRLDPTKVGLPERDILRAKLAKTYNTGGRPVSLVLYYDWDPKGTLTASAPGEDIDQRFVDAVLMPELEKGLGPFDRIWMFERYRPSVLWVYPA